MIMQEIFAIRSCTEILANDIKSIQLMSIFSTVNNETTRHTYWKIFML